LSAYGVASLAQQRFSAGLVDFQIVLETQRNLLSIQNSLAQSWADVSTDQVRLYSALGGGWNPNAAPVASKTTP
jgi:outer membrane protein TolC